MFGLGVTEFLVLIVVGIVVVGPKKLPEMMRTAGGWISRLRRMSTDLRSQSGIDEILRAEGLEKEIRELRSLSRINVMDSLVNAANKPIPPRALTARATATGGASVPPAGGAAGSAPGSGAVITSAGATSTTAAPTSASASAAPSTAAGTTASSSGPASSSGAVAASSAGPAPFASSGAPASSVAGPAPVVPPGAPPPGAIAAAPPTAFARAGGLAGVTAPVLLPGDQPLADREYPPWGCDAYDALPDDLDEEAEAAAPVVIGPDDLPASDERALEPGAA